MIQAFKKTATQVKAIALIVGSIAINFMLYGGSRSGKSFLMVYIMLVRAIKEPNSAHLIVRSTFSAIKNSIWLETLPKVLTLAFPDLPVKWNRSDYYITLPNKSTIKIAGLDDQKKIEKLLGTEYSTLGFNEANQIPYPAISKLKTRLAQKNGLKKICIYDQNPTTTTSALYQIFEQGIDPVDGEAMPEEDRDDYLSFQMNVHGNLENVDEHYLKMLSKLPEKEKKRFLDGEYNDDNAGAAVYAFDREEHVSESAKKLEGTVWVGSDFNIDFNSDVITSQHANGLYVWDEVQLAGDTFAKCDALKRKGIKGASTVSDSTGKARRTSGKSDHIILRDAGFKVLFKTNPHVTDKIANLNRCFTLGLIKINPRCKKLIRDLMQLVWDKHGQLDQKTDPSLSHLVDSLAYLCWHLYPLVEKKPSQTHQL